jgi:PAS domain S-box-containing protein
VSTHDNEEELLRSVALQNASAIFLARQRADQDLILAKEALELKSDALAHSLAMLRATLESATDGILVLDRPRKIMGFNQRFVDMWQIPRAIMDAGEHRQLLEVISPQVGNPRQYLARVEDIYASSPPETFDLLELVDGRVFEQFSRLQIVNERHVGRVWSFRDITERERANEARTRLAAVVESSEDAIVSKTLDGIIRTWNKGAERMFGYTAREVTGRPITILIPSDRSDEEPAIIDRLKKGERIDTYETVRRRKDGTLLHVSLTVSPIKDASGRIIGASKIARDITERKRAEEERLRLTSALERLLESERAARAEAERLSAIKDDFLATLSHELRTPLSAILGWAQVLLRRVPDDAEIRRGLETIERNVRVQTQLIEDLLDMSRITTGKLRLDIHPLEPTSFIEAALETVRPAADAKGVRLEKLLDAGTGMISGDPNRLQQVVWNLLLNAIKFTARGGRVQVLLGRVDSNVEISVTDTGIGIAPEFLPHVFERFRQADASSTRSYGGLGLGLSIVKHVVELHGGTVQARSPGEGRGATFAVQFPRIDV